MLHHLLIYFCSIDFIWSLSSELANSSYWRFYLPFILVYFIIVVVDWPHSVCGWIIGLDSKKKMCIIFILLMKIAILFALSINRAKVNFDGKWSGGGWWMATVYCQHLTSDSTVFNFVGNYHYFFLSFFPRLIGLDRLNNTHPSGACMCCYARVKWPICRPPAYFPTTDRN